jgi:hypothetical protein
VTTHGHADQKTGTFSGAYDARQTTSVVPEVNSGTGINRVDDTIVNDGANGEPALAANPIYPSLPVLPASNGSIIIRLNRTGPCE